MICERIDEISSITNDEYISIVSTYNIFMNDLYNCDKCNSLYPRDLSKRKENQKRLGCDGSIDPKLTYRGKYDMENRPRIIYRKCIGNFFSHSAARMIKYLSKFQQNVMPFEGGYYDQPSKFVEVMDLVQNLVMETQTEKEKAAKRYNGK